MPKFYEDDSSSDSGVVLGLGPSLSKSQTAARMGHTADYSSDSTYSTPSPPSNMVVKTLAPTVSILYKTQQMVKQQHDRSTKTPGRPSSQRDLKAAGPSSRVSSDAASVAMRSAASTHETASIPEPSQDPVSSFVVSQKRKLDTSVAKSSNQSPGVPKPKRVKLKPKRHEMFWLPEGNVIVEIGAVQYKLHKSRLQQNSTYFADIFNIKKEGDGGKVDDLPVYHLTNKVTAPDFESLLAALDDAITYHTLPPPPDATAGILRASTDLSFKKYRKWAIGSLEAMWSDDLVDLTTKKLPGAMEAVLLGRKYRLPAIIKRAFYEVLRSSLLPIAERTSVACHEDTNALVPTAAAASAPVSDSKFDTRFSADDLQVVISVRERLLAAWIASALAAPTNFPECPRGKHGESASHCPSPEAKRAGWIRRVHDAGLFQAYLYDPICGLDALCRVPWVDEEKYCLDCFRYRRTTWDETRQQLWTDLDIWLSVL